MNFIYVPIFGGLFVFLLLFLVAWIVICTQDINITEYSLTWWIYWAIVFVIFLIGLTLDIASYKAEYVHTKTATEHIVALNDNPGIKSNRYYARRAYIESTLYYNYMVKLPGSYIANQIPAKDTYIYETNSNYRVEWWEKEKGYLFSKRYERYWKIYIPENSIISEYEIDLQ